LEAARETQQNHKKNKSTLVGKMFAGIYAAGQLTQTLFGNNKKTKNH